MVKNTKPHSGKLSLWVLLLGACLTGYLHNLKTTGGLITGKGGVGRKSAPLWETHLWLNLPISYWMQTYEGNIALLIAVHHHQGGVKCSTHSTLGFMHRWGFKMLENKTAIITWTCHSKAGATLHFVHTEKSKAELIKCSQPVITLSKLSHWVSLPLYLFRKILHSAGQLISSNSLSDCSLMK